MDDLKGVARAALRAALGSALGGELAQAVVDRCADEVLAATLNHLNKDGVSVEIGSILSARTNEGRVEIKIGSQALQLSIPKAREISDILSGAIEAAISDQCVWAALRDMGVSAEGVGAVLLEMRERRQGSKGVVYPS